ncbi:MAG: DUF1559 domain-containing protein, partial [Pirellulales bacterium]|nr:DUF1559 domain-containing protein [Pirellulales bacterium]
LILNYMETDTLHDMIDINQGHDSARNMFARYEQIPVFTCTTRGPEGYSVSAAKIVLASGNSSNGDIYFFSHYLGIMGAKGQNEFGGGMYPAAQPPSGKGGYCKNGVLHLDSAVKIRDITDGTTHTVMVGEHSWDSNVYRPWTIGMGSSLTSCAGSKNMTYILNSVGNNAVGQNDLYNDVSFGSSHSGGGTHFLFADGSTHLIQGDVALGLLLAAASMNESEPVDIIKQQND